jgi:hypothetical protein
MDYYNTNEQLFVNALIEKKDIKDCYTKAHTIQNQGCDMFALFWKIYIDYYAHKNPKLEIVIMKKQNAWIKNKEDNVPIVYIIKNLFISNSSNEVYKLRNYVMDDDAVFYIYKMKTKKTKYTNLMISIKRKHFVTIAYELVRLVDNIRLVDNDNIRLVDNTTNVVDTNVVTNVVDTNVVDTIDEIFDVIITYFTKHYGGADREKINEKWKNRPQIPSSSIAYYLLAMVVHLYEDEEQTSSSVVIPRKEEIEFYTSLVC